jgi:dihydroflavonol-4-reductase
VERSERKVLLTGASGFIGKHVYRLLTTNAYAIRVITRESVFEPNAEIFLGDIRNAEIRRDAMQGIKIVIHVAGEKRDPSGFWPVNVQGTQNLLIAAHDEGVECFVHISSVGVIGADLLESKVFDEDAPCNPRNDYESSKWEAEKLVREAYSRGLPVTILRPSNVFGDGDPEHGLLSLIRNISRGHFAYLGGKNVICNYVYVEDVAHACIALMENPKAVGRTYHISDDCPLREFIDAIAEELHVKKPDLYLPEFVAASERKALCYWRHRKRSPESSIIARLTALNNRARFHTNRLYDDMRFTYPIGWRKGLIRLIKCYQAEGLL